MEATSALADDLEFAVGIAREAGAILRALFLTDALETRAKADGSPVTVADRRAERSLRARIAARFPADGIVGEEEGEAPGTSGRRWILDPLDGTVSFVRGVPLFGTLVGLEADGEAVLGVCYLPALDELVAGARGLGARWERPGAAPRPARVSRVDRLEDALACVTSARLCADMGRAALHARLLAAVGRDRGWSDCYAHVLVATGRAELVLEPRMALWDCAALAPIVEEAGGTFTSLRGERTIAGGDALVTNGRLFEAARSLLGS